MQLHTNPTPQPSPIKKTQEAYDSQAARIATGYEEADRSAIHQTLLRVFSPGTKLLELGCGSGSDAAFLLGEGFDVTPTDYSRGMLKQAEHFHPELAGRVKQLALPSTFPFESNSFDGVLAVTVLMHLPSADLPKVFSEVSRVLVEGGSFYLSLIFKADQIAPDGFSSDGRYFNEVLASELIAEAQRHGLECKQHKAPDDVLKRKGVRIEELVFQKEPL